jgi:hypothetical protein
LAAVAAAVAFEPDVLDGFDVLDGLDGLAGAGVDSDFAAVLDEARESVR